MHRLWMRVRRALAHRRPPTPTNHSPAPSDALFSYPYSNKECVVTNQKGTQPAA